MLFMLIWTGYIYPDDYSYIQSLPLAHHIIFPQIPYRHPHGFIREPLYTNSRPLTVYQPLINSFWLHTYLSSHSIFVFRLLPFTPSLGHVWIVFAAPSGGVTTDITQFLAAAQQSPSIAVCSIILPILFELWAGFPFWLTPMAPPHESYPNHTPTALQLFSIIVLQCRLSMHNKNAAMWSCPPIWNGVQSRLWR